MLTRHFLHVTEKEFEREQQRVRNIRKQALELSLIVMLITEPKSLRDDWRKKKKKLSLYVKDTDHFATSTEAKEWFFTVKEKHHINT